MQQLAAFIQSTVRVDDDELETILSRFQERAVNKGQFVLKKGQVAGEYIFIKSGGLRFFFNESGQEITAWVALENEFFTEITSLRPQVPTRFYISAIEDSVLFVIKDHDMEQLYNQFAQWQAFGRKIHESMLMRIITQTIGLQTLTAEERYRVTMKESTLLQRVPLKQLSSLLGITSNSLSRIRKNFRR